MCSFIGSGPIKSYTCPATGEKVEISSSITCTDQGVYLLACKKETGLCVGVAPTYVGECGDGAQSSFTHRLAGHVGSALQQCQDDTVKPVGRHFRLQGHDIRRDLFFLPIEKINKNEPFLRKARESYYIKKFKSVKSKSVWDIEHGLNLDRGQ